MSERKVLNKYYPPDFDPSKLERRKHTGKPKSKQLSTVRLMTPFSMRCNTCGEYIHTGKKFNARKEESGEYYYKIQIIRFYIRCPCCAAEISFKTDPKNADYQAEHGAHRPYESTGYRLTDIYEDEAEKAQRESEVSAMSRLEEKTLESQREMEREDALDELRSRNARLERVDPLKVLEKRGMIGSEVLPEQELLAQLDDDEEARRAFKRDAEGNIVRSTDDKVFITSSSTSNGTSRKASDYETANLDDASIGSSHSEYENRFNGSKAKGAPSNQEHKELIVPASPSRTNSSSGLDSANVKLASKLFMSAVSRKRKKDTKTPRVV